MSSFHSNQNPRPIIRMLTFEVVLQKPAKMYICKQNENGDEVVSLAKEKEIKN